MSLRRGNIFTSSSYILVMAIAAGFSLVRGFFVAGILDPSAFGLYATIVATGMFGSSLLSFGQTERTFKVFPRLWAENHCTEVISQADQSTKIMVLRAGMILVLLEASFFVEELQPIAKTGFFVLLISLGAITASLYASAIRSTGAVNLLARNSLLRALFVIILGVSGAYYYQWQGAVFGEAVGTLLGIFLTRHSVIKLANSVDENNPNSQRKSVRKLSDGGGWLFFSTMLASIPIYLDRAFVASVYGNEAVGTFGFLMLFVTCVNTFTGIIVQKIGSHLVKMALLGDSVAAQVKYAFRWLVLIWFVSILGMLTAILTLYFEGGQYFFHKFNLNFSLIIATSILCTLQFGVIADFIMISRNQERKIFFATCLYLICVGMVTVFILFTKSTLTILILLLAFSKLLYVVAQAVFVFNTSKKYDS